MTAAVLIIVAIVALVALAFHVLPRVRELLEHDAPARSSRIRAPNLHAILLRKIRGVAVAVSRAGTLWWQSARNHFAFSLGERPTLLSRWPVLAWLRAISLAPYTWKYAAVVLLAVIAIPATAIAMLPIGAIRHLRAYDEIGTLNITPAQDAGARRYLDLQNNKATRYLQVRIVATVDIATANGVAVRNLGLAESLFTELGVTGGGDGDIVRADPRALAFSSDWQLAASAPTKFRLLSPNIGTTTVSTQFRIWFENPRAAKPRETLFLQKDPQNKLQLFATLSAVTTGAAASSLGSGAIVQGNATTVTTLTGVGITVEQITHAGLLELPVFRPRVTQLNFPINAAGGDIPVAIPIESGEYLRGLTIMQIDANELVSNSAIGITHLSLVGDNFNYVGAGIKVPMVNFALAQDYESGANPYSLYVHRMVHYDFQQEGRLSNLYNPSQDTNLRLLLTIAAPPAGFQVVVVKHSLLRDKFVSADGSRRVVTPEIPADLAEVA